MILATEPVTAHTATLPDGTVQPRTVLVVYGQVVALQVSFTLEAGLARDIETEKSVAGQPIASKRRVSMDSTPQIHCIQSYLKYATVGGQSALAYCRYSSFNSQYFSPSGSVARR